MADAWAMVKRAPRVSQLNTLLWRTGVKTRGEEPFVCEGAPCPRAAMGMLTFLRHTISVQSSDSPQPSELVHGDGSQLAVGPR
jgi:hypothetical protein